MNDDIRGFGVLWWLFFVFFFLKEIFYEVPNGVKCIWIIDNVFVDVLELLSKNGSVDFDSHFLE